MTALVCAVLLAAAVTVIVVLDARATRDAERRHRDRHIRLMDELARIDQAAEG